MPHAKTRWYVEPRDVETNRAIAEFLRTRGDSSEELFSYISTAYGRKARVIELCAHEEVTFLRTDPRIDFILYRRRGNGLLEEVRHPRAQTWRAIENRAAKLFARAKA